MSFESYRRSKMLVTSGDDFYTFLMSAMRVADSGNGAKLASVFPEVHVELQDRYNAPGGLLKGEPGRQELDEERERLGLQRLE
jgi:hypothetical protein